MLGHGSLGKEGEVARRGALVDARHLCGLYFLYRRGHGWRERERCGKDGATWSRTILNAAGMDKGRTRMELLERGIRDTNLQKQLK